MIFDQILIPHVVESPPCTMITKVREISSSWSTNLMCAPRIANTKVSTRVLGWREEAEEEEEEKTQRTSTRVTNQGYMVVRASDSACCTDAMVIRMWFVCLYMPDTHTHSLSLYPSVCLSVCPSVCLSANLSVCLSVCLSVRLSACLFACLCACLPVCFCMCLSFRPHFNFNFLSALISISIFSIFISLFQFHMYTPLLLLEQLTLKP